MKIAMCLAMLLFVTNPVRAQWRLQNSGIVEDLNSVSFVNPNLGWALGTTAVYRSSNGGAEWLKVYADEKRSFSKVAFANANNGLIVGDSGTILHTSDGGTWVKQESNTNASLTDVCFSSATMAWAAGRGVLLKTTNGGLEWTVNNPDSLRAGLLDPQLFFVDSLHGWYTSGGSTLYKTNDGALTWQTIEAGDGPWGSIHFIDTSTGWVGGGYFVAHTYITRFARTTDGGITWTQLDPPTGYPIYSLWFSDRQKGWSPDPDGNIFVTTDGGDGWIPQYRGFMAQSIASLFFLDSNLGWAVGRNGTVLRTTTGGDPEPSLWSFQYPPGMPLLAQVQFVNPEYGWVAAGTRTIRTIDGGLHWTLGFPVDSWGGGPSSSISFVDVSTGWAAMGGNVACTTNGGDTWEASKDPAAVNINSICFVDAKVGYGAGSNLKIIRTADSGKHWIQQDVANITGLPYYYHLSGIIFTDRSHGWAVGTNGITGQGGIILGTTNGGAAWELQTTTSKGLQSIHFCSSRTGWAVGQDGTILGTTDGGTHWQSQSGKTDYMLYSVYCVNRMSCWIAGQGGLILRTTNGGVSWERQTNPANQTLFSVFFLDVNIGWAVGGGGTILNTRAGGGVFFEEPPAPPERPAGYNLSQNYPNPFNSSTTIPYGLPHKSAVQLTVYNTLGQLVATLVQGEKEAGYYEAKFDGSGLASGVYFYRITAGDFVQARKLVLVK